MDVWCGDNVTRIEQSLHGHIFMCEYGAPKHSHTGCRRTYLSQRDLQAHVNHRHKKQNPKLHDHGSKSTKDRRSSDPRSGSRGERAEPRKERNESRADPRLGTRSKTYQQQQVQNYSVASTVVVDSPSVNTTNDYELSQSMVSNNQDSQENNYHVEHSVVRNTNLITVPLQGNDYQAPMQYNNSPVPPPNVQGPYSGPPMAPPEHQAGLVQPQMPYQLPLPRVTTVMAPQPGGYSPSAQTVAPPPSATILAQNVPPPPPPAYNIQLQQVVSTPPNPLPSVVRYDQPQPQPSSYGAPPGHQSTTYSGSPVVPSGVWTAPSPSHSVPVPPPPPTPVSTTSTQPLPVHPDSTTTYATYY